MQTRYSSETSCMECCVCCSYSVVLAMLHHTVRHMRIAHRSKMHAAMHGLTPFASLCGALFCTVLVQSMLGLSDKVKIGEDVDTLEVLKILVSSLGRLCYGFRTWKVLGLGLGRGID